MKTLQDHETPADAELIASPMGLIDANALTNQTKAAIEDGDDIDEEDVVEEESDEPIDSDGDPTGEHDHHQDDNYALGGHVTRSGGV